MDGVELDGFVLSCGCGEFFLGGLMVMGYEILCHDVSLGYGGSLLERGLFFWY